MRGKDRYRYMLFQMFNTGTVLKNNMVITDTPGRKVLEVHVLPYYSKLSFDCSGGTKLC
jgi:hypothetical protein